MTDLTDADLDAIEQRANAASEGPWEHEGVGEIIQHFSLPEPATIVSTDVACMAYCYGGSAAGVERDEDAEFIAHARDDVPALLAEVRRLRATEQRVRELHEWYCAGCEGTDPECGPMCGHCYDPWPCATIAALDGGE